MNALAIVRGCPWRRVMPRTGRQRLEVMALVLIIIGCAGVGLDAAASADPDKLEGKPVPAADVAAVVEAALSCPALNPPKMAAQVMAASAFSATAKQVAGLDNDACGEWRPSTDASRGDRRANILALGPGDGAPRRGQRPAQGRRYELERLLGRADEPTRQPEGSEVAIREAVTPAGSGGRGR